MCKLNLPLILFSQIQTEKYVQDIGRKVTVHLTNEDDEYYDEEEAPET